jgi:transcriptional regulator with XRE-family HTH domain
MTDKQATELGALVRQARQAKGLSLLALSELSGFNESWLIRLERGRYGNPDPSHLARLAELLDIDPAAIDEASSGHLAASLPNSRTYHRSKHQLSEATLDEIDAIVARARTEDAARRQAAGGRR